MAPGLMNSNVQYRWFRSGDLNGFFGLVVDNLSVMAFLATVLVAVFGFPADVVFERMFPGTALGVLVGDLTYTWMAVRLARRTGRADVTAMPLGLDTPSTIGMALLVLGPAFTHFKQTGLDERAAALATWHLGMAATVIMGLLKFGLAFLLVPTHGYIMEAALLSFYYMLSVGVIVWRGVLELRKRERAA